MKTKFLILSAMDTLLVLLMTILLAFGAAVYDKNKGSGSTTYAPIELLQSLDQQSASKRFPPHFIAAIVNKNKCALYEYINGKSELILQTESGAFSKNQLRELSKKKIRIIIYDTDNSDGLGKIVKQLAENGLSIGIAVGETATSNEY